MALPGRTVSSSSYRYGFNGKEKDKDMNSLTAYDYGFRIYNPAIGKFLSVDPLKNDYPELTTYQFSSNKPINSIDIDGLEAKEVYINEWADGRRTALEYQRNDPYGLGKGTLYHVYKQVEVCHDQVNKSTVVTEYRTDEISFYDPPARGVIERITDWFMSLGPNVKVWGSGTEDFGSEADPNKPVYSVNLNDDDWSVLLSIPNLMKVPDLKGAGWEKFAGLTNKLFNAVKAEENKKKKESAAATGAVATSSTPTASTENTKPSPTNNTTPRLEPERLVLKKQKQVIVPSSRTPDGRCKLPHFSGHSKLEFFGF